MTANIFLGGVLHPLRPVDNIITDPIVIEGDVPRKINYQIFGTRGKPGVIVVPRHSERRINANRTRFFNPESFQIVVFEYKDEDNLWDISTEHIVEDIKRVAEKVRFSKWHLFSGGWGSTIALLHAQKYPSNVIGLALGAITTGTDAELDYAFSETGPAAKKHPKEFGEFFSVSQLVGNPRKPHSGYEVVQAYYQTITRNIEDSASAPRRAWARWLRVIYSSELSQTGAGILRSGLVPPHFLSTTHFLSPHILVRAPRFQGFSFLQETAIGVRFSHNASGDLERIQPQSVLEENNMKRIKHIPMIFVRGTNDLVCPPEIFEKLQRLRATGNFDQLHLFEVEGAGHSYFDRGNAKILVEEIAKIRR